jgi:hypothetical protein
MNPRLCFLALAAGLIFAGSGCHTTNSAGTSAQSAVVITNQPETLIRVAVMEVFAAEHYQLKSAKGNTLVFEKPGSSMDTVVWGGWQESGVWTRAKVQIKPFGRTEYVLECEGFRVRGRGDSVFEEEQRMLKAGPYRKLLDQVVAKLQ